MKRVCILNYFWCMGNGGFALRGAPGHVGETVYDEE